jgi:hypothetical protein
MLTIQKQNMPWIACARSGDRLSGWLARAGLFDSVNLKSTIAKSATIIDCD